MDVTISSASDTPTELINLQPPLAVDYLNYNALSLQPPESTTSSRRMSMFEKVSNLQK